MKPIQSAIITIVFLLICNCCCCAPIRLKTGTFEPGTQVSISAATSDENTYIVQFSGPVQDNWKQSIIDIAGMMGDYIPDYAFEVNLNSRQLKQVRKLPFVEWVGKMESRHRVDPILRAKPYQIVEAAILLTDTGAVAQIQDYLSIIGGIIIHDEPGNRQNASNVIKARLPRTALYGLAAVTGVKWVEEWVQPLAENNVVSDICGVENLQTMQGIFGDGQIVTVADTGLDTGNLGNLHADFSGRVYKTYGIKRPGNWSDQNGHGTHIIGILAGSGEMSGSNPASHSYTGSFAGIAPEASLIIQSIGDSTSFLYPPLDLSELFFPAYSDGSRIHSNSWGSPASGSYTIYSRQVDEFVWSHKDFITVFPVGNDSRDGNRDGITDPSSLYTPGTAKNCISVGSTESERTTGRITTYGAAWAQDFQVYPISNDQISNYRNGMAAWSGRGPCSDGRIKPDICAPGTNIISTRAQTVMNSGWHVYDNYYIYWGGTSQSTPMVAGASALVREYYVKERSIQPSAALIKATLLNAAFDMYPGQYGYITQKDISKHRPENSQGWGRLDVAECVNPPAPKSVEYTDDTVGVNTGAVRQYQYQITGSDIPLSVTLAWSDYPASLVASKALVNDLDLEVIAPNGFTLYRGNGGTAADDTNNVETVDIQTPSVGTYTVIIRATNIPQGPQPYALVVSGRLPSAYIAGRVATSSGNPVSGVDITVTGQNQSKSTITDGSGKYAISLDPGNYNVTASKAQWDFVPPSQNVVLTEQGLDNTNFTGSANPAGISGTITRAVGGVVNYVLESPHPYFDNMELRYVISAHPNAQRIRVHFSEIELQDDYDLIYVENFDGSQSFQLTGTDSDIWSDWIDGNTAYIRLVSDTSETYWGFHIDGYETDIVELGGQQGIALQTSPTAGSATSDVNGSYTIMPVEPIGQTIQPSRLRWRFIPAEQVAEVPPSPTQTPQVTLSGIDFLAFPPATISGTVVTGDILNIPTVYQSTHPYMDEANQSWTVKYTGPESCNRIRLHFSKIEMELNFDYVIIQDTQGNVIDVYTGEYPAGAWSSWVPGNELIITLRSDQSYGNPNTYWGFAADKYMIAGNDRPVYGAKVSLEPDSQTVHTGPSGSFDFNEVQAGIQCNVEVSSPFFDIMPQTRTLSTISGTVSTLDFFGIPTSSTAVSNAKLMPDNVEVWLSGVGVTAGTPDFDDYLYVESKDRTSGIRVAKPSHGISAGSEVSIRGIMRTGSSGERYIEATAITQTGSAAIDPLALLSRNLGGADWEYDSVSGAGQVGVWGSTGLNNIGMLVKIAGRVTYAGRDSLFYVDDGSSVTDGSGVTGIYVEANGLDIPQIGAIVAVTGISSCDRYMNNVVNTLIARNQEDIIVLSPPDGAVAASANTKNPRK